MKNVGNRKKTKNKDLYEEQYRWSGNSSGIALLGLWICKKPLNDESIKSFHYSAVSVFSGSSGVIRTISFGEQSRS